MERSILAVRENQTEGMPYGIEEHPERLSRLEVGLASADAENELLGLIEVVHRKVKVYLLGHTSFGPRWRDVVLDFLKT